MMIAALLAALSFTQTPSPAATGRLSGRVTAEGTNAPIAGARVMVFPMMRTGMPENHSSSVLRSRPLMMNTWFRSSRASLSTSWRSEASGAARCGCEANGTSVPS